MKPSWSGLLLAPLALIAVVSLTCAAEGDQTVKGKITDIQPATHQLTIKTDAGQSLTLRVDDRSQLQLHQKAAKLGDFHKGMAIQATYQPRNGTNHVLSLNTAPVSAAEVKRQFQEALQSAKTYTFQQKPQYEAKLKGVLQQVDAQMDEWKAQAEKATGQAKKEAQAKLNQLKPLRDKVDAQLQKVKSATPQAWEDIKAGVGSAFEDLRKAFEKASSHF